MAKKKEKKPGAPKELKSPDSEPKKSKEGEDREKIMEQLRALGYI